MDGGGRGGTGVVVKSSFYILLGLQQVYVTCPLDFSTALFTSDFSSIKQTYLARCTVCSIHISGHFTVNIMAPIN